MRCVPNSVGGAVRLVVVLLLTLSSTGLASTGGRQDQQATKAKKPHVAKIACKNYTVTVDPAQKHGVDHANAAIVMCPGYTITWVEPTHKYKFQVDFDDYPFDGGPKIITDLDGTSGAFPAGIQDTTVFKYTLTVYDGGGYHKSFDPHVIGGGGIPIE